MNNRHSRRPILIGLTLLFAIILGGVWLIFSYLDLERERDLGDWRIRLGLIADDRAAGIDQWLTGEFANLGELANNASLQLYLSQLSTQTNTTVDVEPAQLGYLRNLINAAAERGGYRALGEPEPLVRANLPTAGYRGLALLDREGRVVVATPGMPALDAEDRALVLHVISTGQPALRDLRVSAQGQTTLGFLVPIATVQGMQDATGQSRVGVLLGIKSAATELVSVAVQSRRPDRATTKPFSCAPKGHGGVSLATGRRQRADSTQAGAQHPQSGCRARPPRNRVNSLSIWTIAASPY